MRVCALRSSQRYGRYLKDTRRGLAIDRQAIAALERFDGKFVVHSNDDTLSAEDMVLGYKQQRVEECWRTLKSGLKLRPVFHWAPIASTPMSPSRSCRCCSSAPSNMPADTWRNIRDALKKGRTSLCLIYAFDCCSLYWSRLSSSIARNSLR
jgi:hypothetical protein